MDSEVIDDQDEIKDKVCTTLSTCIHFAVFCYDVLMKYKLYCEV